MLLLALLIIMVSGLVAYVGDLIGRKMGRKRLTLFGLRPRYTAIIISVAAGMLIAILTLAAAFAFSSGIRKAFLVPIDKLQMELKTNTDKLHTTQQLLSTAEDQRQVMQGQYDQASTKLTDVNQRLDANQQKLGNVQQDMTKIENELKQSQAMFGVSEKQLQEIRVKKEKLETERNKLESEQQDLKNERDALRTLIEANYTKLAFVTGQEIVSAQFPMAGGETLRKQRLDSVMGVAQKIVRQQCTELKLANGEDAFLYIQWDGKNARRIDKDAAYGILAKRIVDTAKKARVTSVILRLTPWNNVPVSGKPIIVPDTVQIIPNDLVFHENVEVARIEVAPTTATAEILGDLVEELLQQRVPQALRQKNMPLIVRRYDPRKPDDVPPASLSFVSWTDLLAAAQKAHDLSGKAAIVARAQNDIRAFDPVQLSLDVLPAP